MVKIRAAVVILAFLKITSFSCKGEKEFQIPSVPEVTELWNLDQNLFKKSFFFQFKTKQLKIKV